MSTTPAPSPTQGALPPPDGVKPNLVNPKSSLQTVWLAAVIVCLVVPSILVPLRSYIKLHLVKRFRPADVVCVLAWLLFIGLIVCPFMMYHLGVGLHAWDLPLDRYSRFAEIINIHQVLYMPSILFTKVAILLQLQDIFVHGQRNVRWYTLQGLIILNSIFFTILLFLEIFECVPRRKIWDPTVEGRCINIEKTFVATGVINVLDDFIILILPLYWVWQLKISTRKRAAICLVFAAGLFACIASVMRLLYSIFSIGSVDITYKLMPVALWATAEVSSGLVVCCLPVLPRLFKGKKVIPGSNGTYDSGRTFTSYKKGSSRRYREVDDISLGQVPLNYTTVEAQQSRDHDVSAAKGERDFMESLPKPAILQTVSIDQESNARSPTG